MGLSPKSNYEKKKILVLTSGKFLEGLGSGIGTCSIFCLSFALSNRVLPLEIMYVISNVLNTYPCLETLKSYYSHAWKSWFSHHRRILSSNSFFSRQKYLSPPFILLGVVHKIRMLTRIYSSSTTSSHLTLKVSI